MASQQSTRIWENDSPKSTHSRTSQPQPATLPSIATLTNELPPGASGPASPAYTNNRSSDQWATPPQSTSKKHIPPCSPFSTLQEFQDIGQVSYQEIVTLHIWVYLDDADLLLIGSSAYSSGHNGFHFGSSVNSPHRASNSSQLGATSHPADYQNGPTSAASVSSPGFAPSNHNSLGLPTINQHEQSQYRNSHEFPPQESRRSSLGSQVNTGFNNLHINNVGSPYHNHSAQQSQSSIAASLQRERGIPHTNGVRNSGTSSIQQQPMSPLAQYPGESTQSFSSRTGPKAAPMISANPMKEVYNAEKPTAGQPYAFPDPDMSNRSSGSAEASGSAMMSRRNSDHTSITSSIVTNDSRYPSGQHHLDESKSIDLSASFED